MENNRFEKRDTVRANRSTRRSNVSTVKRKEYYRSDGKDSDYYFPQSDARLIKRDDQHHREKLDRSVRG